ncbi:MAG: hypothetical protein BMS9Abin10_0519 [Gammaproteobacteria bacterium]|nr:MAG: hypothetical protein BMS9Abin10_0519 [Gammaproteobacteria bacterium]
MILSLSARRAFITETVKVMIEVQVRLFNSLSRYGNGENRFCFRLPKGASVDQVLQRLDIPQSEIFLLMHNGRNIMRGFGPDSGIETEHVLADGDILAFSGPVPFSRGYGSPVC